MFARTNHTTKSHQSISTETMITPTKNSLFTSPSRTNLMQIANDVCDRELISFYKEEAYKNRSIVQKVTDYFKKTFIII